VLEHTPADLTVTVPAGTRFAELQEALRPSGQFFPNDPPFAPETTIGGMLSSRASGALRQRYGASRGHVLGMRVCLSDGSIAFTGARVVKSVAGYDIAKLFVGAWGTLGFIGDVTLKVAPLPREQLGIVASFARCEPACEAALRIASSPLFPLATTLHDRASARRIRALSGADPGAAWTLVVRCGGTRAGAMRQADGIAEVVKSSGSSSVDLFDADRLHFAWQDIAELAGGAMYPGSQYLCCAIASLPSQMSPMLASISGLFPDAHCTAHPATGIVYAHLPVAAMQQSSSSPLSSQLQPLLDLCEREHYYLSYLAAPAGSDLRAPVPADAPILLMRRVKASFDPSGTFDPGRFMAGI
ncbi:MAG TPA: FAD-binding oxidoreductase, partial [Candidatus Acidoferrales bacterium]|nr:FAD-binding oxidoreductase [Candidatus Acidoferrales bacterium]